MANQTTEPIQNPDVKSQDGEEEEDDGDYDLCPAFCTTDVPEEVLNFVLETVSHGFGLDFIDDNDVFCDECTEVIFGKYFHCNKCNDGDFDLCANCKKSGKHCENKEHELEECGEDIDEDEVDEALRSDCGCGHDHDHEMADGEQKEGEEDDDEWEDDESDDGLEGESPLYVVKDLEPDVSKITLRSRAPMEAFSSPFKGWTPEKLYDFWKAKLQRPENEVCATHLSAFTFVVIDEETVKSYQAAAAAAPSKENKEGDEELEDLEAIGQKLEKTTVLVCSDAPDFGEAENEVKFKTVRMSLNDAATAITAFELLAVCPSEFGKEEVLEVMPPPTLEIEDTEMKDVDEEDEDGMIGLIGKPATPKKARENKRKAIIEAEKNKS